MPKMIDSKIKKKAESLRKKGKTIREVFEALDGKMSMGSIQSIKAGYHYGKRKAKNKKVKVSQKAKARKLSAARVVQKETPSPKAESGDAQVQPGVSPDCVESCPVEIETQSLVDPPELETNIGSV